MPTLHLDEITIEITRKKIKNMIVRVCAPQGQVKISAPMRSSEAAVRRFATDHLEWIRNKQAKYQQVRQQVSQYQTGESQVLQGKQYVLRVHATQGPSKAQLTDEYIDLFVPIHASEVLRKQAIWNFYHDTLRQELNRLIPFWENKIGVNANGYKIKYMKSRWGSCQPIKKMISINLALVRYPKECLEYVLIHELVHLIEPSHNARFKKILTDHLPNWQEINNLLKTPLD